MRGMEMLAHDSARLVLGAPLGSADVDLRGIAPVEGNRGIGRAQFGPQALPVGRPQLAAGDGTSKTVNCAPAASHWLIAVFPQAFSKAVM